MQKIASRNLNIDMYLDDEHHLHAYGRLTDDKNVTFESFDGKTVYPGCFHDLSAEMVIDLESFEILDIKTAFDKYPEKNCPDIASVYSQLIGLVIASGYTKKVLNLAGGKKGCAHLTHLIIVMGAAIVQGAFTAIASDKIKKLNIEFLSENEVNKYFIGSCHVW